MAWAPFDDDVGQVRTHLDSKEDVLMQTLELLQNHARINNIEIRQDFEPVVETGGDCYAIESNTDTSLFVIEAGAGYRYRSARCSGNFQGRGQASQSLRAVTPVGQLFDADLNGLGDVIHVVCEFLHDEAFGSLVDDREGGDGEKEEEKEYQDKLGPQ